MCELENGHITGNFSIDEADRVIKELGGKRQNTPSHHYTFKVTLSQEQKEVLRRRYRKHFELTRGYAEVQLSTVYGSSDGSVRVNGDIFLTDGKCHPLYTRFCGFEQSPEQKMFFADLAMKLRERLAHR